METWWVIEYDFQGDVNVIQQVMDEFRVAHFAAGVPRDAALLIVLFLILK